MGLFGNDEETEHLIKETIREEISLSMNHYLSEFRRLVDMEIKSIKDTSETVNGISELNKLRESMVTIAREVKTLQESKVHLHKEIQKRDAIIERKSKQIERLKGNK